MKTVMNKEIKAMSGSTDKILQALEAEQIRRLNLTKEDLQKSYRKLAEQNFS